MKSAKLTSAILLWSLGGALNAAHCLIFLSSREPSLKWHLVPAGALHGLVLAAVPVLLAFYLENKNVLARVLGLLAAGYFSGWISWIFLGWSLEGKWDVSYLWVPFRSGFSAGDSLISPFSCFGLVGSFYYLFLAGFHKIREPKIPIHVLIAAVSGMAGSLWFWSEIKPLYFSVLHGAVWGIFTGLGTSRLKENS